MRFTLYPYPPVRALSPPGGSVFTRFVARSERVAELDPPYAQVIFVRVAMLGGTAPPGLLVAAGAGAPVEVSVDTQGVFRSPGGTGYVGDVWLNPLSPNLFEILVGLVCRWMPGWAGGWGSAIPMWWIGTSPGWWPTARPTRCSRGWRRHRCHRDPGERAVHGGVAVQRGRRPEGEDAGGTTTVRAGPHHLDHPRLNRRRQLVDVIQHPHQMVCHDPRGHPDRLTAVPIRSSRRYRAVQRLGLRHRLAEARPAPAQSERALQAQVPERVHGQRRLAGTGRPVHEDLPAWGEQRGGQLMFVPSAGEGGSGGRYRGEDLVDLVHRTCLPGRGDSGCPAWPSRVRSSPQPAPTLQDLPPDAGRRPLTTRSEAERDHRTCLPGAVLAEIPESQSLTPKSPE